MAEKTGIGNYAIFPKREPSRVLGSMSESDAILEAWREEKRRPGTLLVKITDKGGSPVDFLAGECPKGMCD